MAEQERAPHPVDIHVGGRVRVRRRVLGLSQEALADALGLTFQQVQKYERGANRISASKLFAIAAALQAPVAYFFDGLPEPDPGQGVGSEAAILALLASAEGEELARAFPLIRERGLRRQVLELVRAMVAAAEPEGALLAPAGRPQLP